MNPRERVLAILLGCVIILGGAGFFGYQFVYVPWQKRAKDLDKLKDDYNKKLLRIEEIKGHQAELARWRMLSLPDEQDVAQREYVKYLTDLLSRHKVAPGQYTVSAKQLDKHKPAAGGAGKDKEPTYQKLTFNVTADATMRSLVGVLEEFYKTGLLHEVKSLSVQRQVTNTDPSKANDLTVHMTIEALIVTGADKRSYVLPNIDRRLLAADLAATLAHGPTGLGLALWAAGPAGPAGPGLLAGTRPSPAPSDADVASMFFESPRHYEAIAFKNVFLGRQSLTSDQDAPPVWLAPRFVHLSGITTDHIGKVTASLYDVSTNNFFKLRATAAYDTFTFVKDGDRKSVLRGVVVKIDDREVTYRAEVAAEDAPAERGAERDGFCRLDKKERERLVEENVVKAEEADQVYRVKRSYWEALTKSLIIRPIDRDSFRIQLERDGEAPTEDSDPGTSVEVVRGRVLQSDSGELLVRVEPRYFSMHLGQTLADSLKRALPREQVKDLKVVAN
jgi:hypothetical protein